MSLLAAAEAKRMYSCLYSSGGAHFSDREGSEYKVYRSLPPSSIPITRLGNVPGAISPTTNRQLGVHHFTNFDPLPHNCTAMSLDTGPTPAVCIVLNKRR